MERSTRQAVLAELWGASTHAAVLELLARSPDARAHDLVHAVHEQALECKGTAPEVSAQLEAVAGRLAEIHAALRSAESVGSLRGLLRWQAEAAWRTSPPFERLVAAVAASTEPSQWPWPIGQLPALQVELLALVDRARQLVGQPSAVRRSQIEADDTVCWPEFTLWLATRASADDEAARGFAELREHAVAWRRLHDPGPSEGSGARISTGEMLLAELQELWYRLDPTLDRTCAALCKEVVEGQRSLTEALDTVAVGAEHLERAQHRRAYLLYHLLDEPAVSTRRAAVRALADLVTQGERGGLDRGQRAPIVVRWGNALDLHWRVLAEPVAALERAVAAIEQSLPAVVDGRAPRVARDLLLLRARLLRRLARWQQARLAEAVRAYEMVLQQLGDDPDRGLRGRTLVELASLRRSRREGDAKTQDRELRALYDRALDDLDNTVLLRARALADYAVYLARPLRAVVDDEEQAIVLATRAVDELEHLPEALIEHPVVRGEIGACRLVLGNVRLEVGRSPAPERRERARADYERGLGFVEHTDELLTALLHLNLALVALGSGVPGRRDDAIAQARAWLDRAEPGLRPLPVAHARALAELANIAVSAAPEDEGVRRRCIAQLEGALHRLPVASDRVAKARVQRQLGTLYLGRDGADDSQRAAEYFAAARSGFVEGGATRLAVEVARDYAESQLRQHADSGEPAALIRGAMVLEQASLLAERRWSTRRSAESTEKLAAMLDGVYGDLAWFQAKLEREPSMVLRTVCRAKWFRASPSLRALRSRSERSAMLSPAHLDPLARRLAPPPRPGVTEPNKRRPSARQLLARVDAFRDANPGTVALDLTLTRWGSVAVAVGGGALRYATLSISRETVRRWVWGDASAPGWWSRYLGLREARAKGDAAAIDTRERAFAKAGIELAAQLGARVVEPALVGLGLNDESGTLLIAPGRLTGLPFAAARVGGKSLVEKVAGLAQLPSLSALPAGPLPLRPAGRALCVVADPAAPAPGGATEELADVVRLLASARADVEVLARVGDALGAAAYRPGKARTRGRTSIGGGQPSVDAVLSRADALGHLYYGGQGLARGLALVDGHGRPARLDGLALGRGPRWMLGSSVFVSGATRVPVPTDDTAIWGLAEQLREAGVGAIVLPVLAVAEGYAHDFARSFYLYWALGRTIPEALCAALVKVAGSDVTRLGAFAVVLGALDAPEAASADPPPGSSSGTKST